MKNSEKSKRCPDCRELKPHSAFSKSTKNGLQPYCKPCSAKRNREQVLKARYGITTEQYEAMLVSQRGLCAICREPQEGNRQMAVDHNHETGKVRGLLCDRCNRGIGLLRDSPLVLRAAVDYLEQHSA